MELTKDNWFTFGHGGVPFADRTPPLEDFFATYGRCSRKPDGFYQEGLNTARLIEERFGRGNITLCMSGGIDSILMAKMFRDAGVQFHATILIFKDYLNIHDVSFAIAYCSSTGTKYRLMELDIRSFLTSNKAIGYARMTNCMLMPYLPQLYMLDHIDGYVPIVGSSEVHLYWNRGRWEFWEQEHVQTLYRFQLKTGIDAVCGFYQYTPEFALSWLREPEMINLMFDPKPAHECTGFAFKAEIYHRKFGISRRPKFIGTERLKEENPEIFSGSFDAFFRMFPTASNPEPVIGFDVGAKVTMPVEDYINMTSPT